MWLLKNVKKTLYRFKTIFYKVAVYHRRPWWLTLDDDIKWWLKELQLLESKVHSASFSAPEVSSCSTRSIVSRKVEFERRTRNMADYYLIMRSTSLWSDVHTTVFHKVCLKTPRVDFTVWCSFFFADNLYWPWAKLQISEDGAGVWEYRVIQCHVW